MTIILTIALTFGVLYLLDKNFTRIFRGQEQHKSGLSVRLPKMYAVAGIILSILAVLALITEFDEHETLMRVCGIFIGLMGLSLIVYYMTFGIFYDENSLILTTFGKKSVTYYYKDIRAQQLYLIQGGGVVIELHMADGGTVSVQSKMEGAYAFLDKAFYGWCRQNGLDPDSCAFHDPDNSLWFPPVEG